MGRYSELMEQGPIDVRGGKVQRVDGAGSYRCEGWEGTVS